LSSETAIADGGDWQGWVTFDLTAQDAGELRSFMTGAHELTLVIAPPGQEPLTFRFPIDRPAPGVQCPDGVRRAQLADCPDMATATAPVDDGPCIQHTMKPRTIAGTQWWMGGTPVANSDLHRTLLTEPLTHGPMQRGLWMRAAGYSLVGLGIMGVAIASPVFAHTLGLAYGPVGISFLGLSAIGLVIAVVGSRESDRAIKLYNEQADATGMCAPIW
jgi:hypothetical protein